MRSCLLVILCHLVPTAGVAVAGESAVDTTDLRVGTSAESIARPNPRYPPSALRHESEGWVWVSYVIQPTGSVSDVIVEQVVGSKVFAEAATSAVKTWTFKPATWQGAAVEQCSNNVIVKFQMDPPVKGARSQKVTAFRRIERLIESNELDEAEKQLAAIMGGELNLYELAYFNLQGARIARMRGSKDDEVYYLGNADVGDRLLGRKTSRSILQRLFIVQAQSGRFTDALTTFDELQKYRVEVDDWKAYEDIHSQLVALRDGNQPVIREGIIPASDDGEWSLWTRPLLKRSVEIGEMKGELGRIEFRCDRKYVSDAISPGKNWTLPDGWGECAAYVFGKTGATFRLYEFPGAGGSTSGS